MNITIRIKRLNVDAVIPKYQTAGASGLDLHALDPVRLEPGERALVQTGLAIELPQGYEAQVRPRSGLSLRHGIVAVMGTIDADYRGPVGVTIVNLSGDPYTVLRGDRIAQLVVAPVARAWLTEVAELSGTERGESGYGSTGVR